MRATTAGRYPAATSSRDRAARSVTPSLPRVPPRSPARTSCGPALAPTGRPCAAAPRSPTRRPGPGVALLAGFQQLVAPGVVERLGDLMVAAQLLDGLLAAQPGEHDPKLLLRAE